MRGEGLGGLRGPRFEVRGSRGVFHIVPEALPTSAIQGTHHTSDFCKDCVVYCCCQTAASGLVGGGGPIQYFPTPTDHARDFGLSGGLEILVS